MTKNIKSYLAESRSLVDKALDKYLPKSVCEPKMIHRAMRYSVFSGGKRIRPIIALEACKVCCGARRHFSDALAIASAIEMVHAYSLIHDDLPSMDDDDYRRGKPACHKKFGEANAILAGDALLTLAFNVLTKNLEAETAVAAVRELSEAIGTYGMVGGQAMDIDVKDKRLTPIIKQRINYLKTAKLFQVSAKLGAIAADANDKKIEAMAEFGESLGVAFQLIDDAMDSDPRFAVPSKLVKVRGSAQDATFKAISALDIFGSDGDRLREISEVMLKRRI